MTFSNCSTTSPGPLSFAELAMLAESMPKGPTAEQLWFAEAMGYGPHWNSIKCARDVYENPMSGVLFRDSTVLIDDTMKPGTWTTPQNDWDNFQRLIASESARSFGIPEQLMFGSGEENYAAAKQAEQDFKFRMYSDFGVRPTPVSAVLITMVCDPGDLRIRFDRKRPSYRHLRIGDRVTLHRSSAVRIILQKADGLVYAPVAIAPRQQPKWLAPHEIRMAGGKA